MRVIRTEVYFEPGEIRAPAKRSIYLPGFAIAFINTQTNRLISPYELGDGREVREGYFRWITTERVLSAKPEPEYPIGEANRENVASVFIDLCLRGKRLTRPTGLANLLINSAAVNQILATEVITERSPPDATPFRELLKKSGHVAIGSFIGYNAARDRPWVMLLSIPGGIIIAGAAVGISKGLLSGLQRAVERRIRDLT
jgi:hypothetical protein